MIKTKTVLVLGAGASFPYGFPVGRQLQLSICRNLENVIDVATRRAKHWPDYVPGKSFSDLMLSCGFKYDALDKFARELAGAMQPSVDAFLENRNEFLEIGKAAIAASLIPCEHEPSLIAREDPNETKWYEYLYTQMGARESEFPHNQLAIITFNYDRSLEYFLFSALMHSYGLTPTAAADLLIKVPIVRVHGQLGQPHFWSDKGRPYSNELSPTTIKQCASEIRILHEQLATSEELDKAHTLLAGAEIVCFLGFGYHPVNLARLQLDKTLREDAHILCSVYRLGDDEIQRVFDSFHPLVKGVSRDYPRLYRTTGKSSEHALLFLKSHPVFR